MVFLTHLAAQELLGLDAFELTVLGFVVGLIALVVAGMQLKRTADAVEATGEAVRRAEQHLALNQLLILIPQLIGLEQAIEDAAEDNDRRTARRGVTRWRDVASEVKGLLSNHDSASEKFAEYLTESLTLAHSTKARLLEQNGVAVLVNTKKMRATIAQTCIEANIFAGTLKTYSGEKGDLK